MEKLKALYKLTRFEHAIMIIIAIFIAESIVLGHLPEMTAVIALSLIAPVLVEMSSFALNDYFDIESDRINKKKRPLVEGTVTKGEVLFIVFSGYLVAVLLSLLINFYAFTIIALFSLFSILYNWKLKKTVLLGNGFVALTMAIPFIYGSLVVSETIPFVIVVISIISFLVGLGREITKTVQDMEGDKKGRKARTLPMVFGVRKSLNISVFLYFMAVLLSLFLIAQWLNYLLIPSALIIVADVIFLYLAGKLLVTDSKDFLKTAQNLSLVGLFIALIGMLIAVI